MRKIFYFILISISLLSCSDKPPIFTDNQGHTVELSSQSDKWLVLSYWAPWCHTCLQEMPELNKFSQHMNNKTQFFGVNYDGYENAPLNDVIKQMHITFPVLTQDPLMAWNLGEIEAVPTIFIINPAGKVVKKIVGPVTEVTLLETVNALQHT